MAILILDGSLKVDIFFDENDSEFDDDVCISFTENCTDEEKIFRADQTNIYITPEQACQLARALNITAQQSMNCNEI